MIRCYSTSEKARLVIPGSLSGLNEYTRANRAHWSKGAKSKRTEQTDIEWLIHAAKLPHFTGPVSITFDWYEPDRLRDPDNICFARKFILDALVAKSVITNDGWKYLSMPEPFRDRFFVDKENPRIEVTITSGAVVEQKPLMRGGHQSNTGQ